MQGKPFFSREVTGVEVAVVGVDTVTGVEVEFSRLTLTVLKEAQVVDIFEIGAGGNTDSDGCS